MLMHAIEPKRGMHFGNEFQVFRVLDDSLQPAFQVVQIAIRRFSTELLHRIDFDFLQIPKGFLRQQKPDI